MVFKIIQTIENGPFLLTTVPHKWVTNGTLSWPPCKSMLSKLRKDGNSMPEITWDKFPCVVKRTNITSYTEAVEIEKQLLDCSNSEAEQKMFSSSRSKKYVVQSKASQINNYDDLFEKNDMMTINNNNDNLQLHNSPQEIYTQDIYLDPPGQPQPSEFLFQEPQSCNENNQTFNLDFSYFEQRLEKLEILSCQMNAKLDKIIDLLKNCNKVENNVALPDILQAFPFPLTEVEQVEQLELKLMDESFKKKIISELQRMNGTTGNLDGKKVSYRLIDWLFDRKLLMEYTWTGSSKKKAKHAFIRLKLIFDMIYQVVNCADTKVNIHIMEDFLKINLLKYQESRCNQLEHKQTRNIDKKKNFL